MIHYLKEPKEKEHVPTAIGTSSTKEEDTFQLDNSTKEKMYQEVENARYRLEQAFDEDLDSNLGIRLYGEAMGLLEAIVHSLKGEKQ